MMQIMESNDYQVNKLVDLPFYTEGPVKDKEGNYYFTTLAGASIMQLAPNGVITTWAQTPCPNGQLILPNGDHLVCDSQTGCIVRLDATGQFLQQETPSVIQDVKVNVPNDLVTDRQGNLYFTDSVRHVGRVFYKGVDGTLKIIAENIDYPNGIALSLDETVLFVAESYKNRIIQMAITSPGVADANFSTFAELPIHISGNSVDNLPDGISIHESGMMAVAHYGMQAVYILSSTGKVERVFDTTMPNTSNVIFLDDHTLLVTGGYGEPGPGAVVTIQF